MDWKNLEEGSIYDWNEANRKFASLKSEINDLPQSAVRRHSLSHEHLPSTVKAKSSEHVTADRYSAARGPNIRGPAVDNTPISSFSAPVTGETWDDSYTIISTIDVGVDIYPDYVDRGAYTATGTSIYDIRSPNFITSPTGLLVMAEVEFIKWTTHMNSNHLSILLQVNCGPGDGSHTASITVPGSERFIRQNHVSTTQRIESSLRYMISWEDISLLTSPMHGHSVASVRYINSVRLLTYASNNASAVQWKFARLSSLHLHHGFCSLSKQDF